MRKLIITYLILLSALTVIAVLALRMLWPEHYPSGLFLIPLFYAVMLGVMVIMYRLNAKNGLDRSYFFMSYIMVRILLALILILVYFKVVRSEMPAFAIIFMTYYLCLTAVETTLLIKEEKKG